MQRLQSLDGLRGILALAVAVYHLTDRDLLPGAYIAVDMFFIMSGFILCHAYGPKLQQYGLLSFLHRRAARLMPVYLVTGIALIPMVLFGFPLEAEYVQADSGRYSPLAFLAYMPALQLLMPGYYWNHPGWSVSGELWLSLAIFVALPWIVRGRAGGFICVLAASMLYGIVIVDHGNLSIIGGTVGPMPGVLLRPMSGFLMGVGIFKLSRETTTAGQSVIGLKVVEAGLLLCCFALPVIVGRTELDFIIVISFSALTFLLIVCGEKLTVTGLLMSRPVLFLGMISYSIYLWHTIIQHFFLRGVREGWLEMGTFAVTTYLAVVVAISYLSYKFVEIPAQQWLNAREPISRAPFISRAR